MTTLLFFHSTITQHQKGTFAHKMMLQHCVLAGHLDKTRQAYTLLQDVWNNFPYIGGWGERKGLLVRMGQGAKSLWCRGYAGRQIYRNGGGARCNKSGH